MNPYTFVFPGTYTRITTGQAPILESVPARRRNLVGGGGNRGNYVSPTPFHYEISDFTFESGSWTSTLSDAIDPSQNYSSSERGVLATGSTYIAPLAGPTIDRLVNAAYNSCIDKLTEKVRGSLDLSVAIAEAGQTRKMLAVITRWRKMVDVMHRSYLRKVWQGPMTQENLQKRLVRWQKGLFPRKWRRYYRPIRIERGLVSRVSAAGANGWLEFTYGMMPLYNDIYGLARAALGQAYNWISHIKVRASRVITQPVRGSNSKGRPLRGTYNGDIKVTVGLKLSNSFDPGLAAFTSLNPLSTVYEATRLSFVLDWFINLGGYLRNFETALLYGNAFAGGYTTTVVAYNAKAYCAYRASGKSGNATWTESGSTSAGYATSVFSRTLLSGYPRPMKPLFKVDLGGNQLLSAAALLRQMLKR